MIVLSILIFGSQIRASDFKFYNIGNDTLTLNSPAQPDNCNHDTLSYDDNKADIGYTDGVAGQVFIGNYFPFPDTCEGVIKTADIYFSSNTMTSAQSCILYIYNSSQVLIATSPPFINTGATWPGGTWVQVFINDVPYRGPFYAMVDYTITHTPEKNLLDVDTTTIQPGFPNGLGFTYIGGVWSPASVTFGGSSKATFLERITGCGCDESTGIKELSPASLSLYPNPAKDKCQVQSAKCNIKSIEIFNLTGDKVYRAEFPVGTGNSVEVDLDFPAGIYFVRVMDEKGMGVQKLVVE
jgi:hypothetical protein